MRFILSVFFIFQSFIFCPAASTKAEKIDALLDKIHREDGFSGNVLIAEKGKSSTPNHSATPMLRLKLNAERFPQSFNVWDSLGEAYYQAGKREEAAKNYEKSLQLNPNNTDGRRMLEKIRRGEKP